MPGGWLRNLNLNLNFYTIFCLGTRHLRLPLATCHMQAEKSRTGLGRARAVLAHNDVIRVGYLTEAQ